ncbi:MAG: hypothetical protein II226_00480 [Alistipes sp.]|nr:hypothetical protein [Alistipes sp.]
MRIRDLFTILRVRHLDSYFKHLSLKNIFSTNTKRNKFQFSIPALTSHLKIFARYLSKRRSCKRPSIKHSTLRLGLNSSIGSANCSIGRGDEQKPYTCMTNLAVLSRYIIVISTISDMFHT